MNATQQNNPQKPATLLVPQYDREGHFSAMDLYQVDPDYHCNGKVEHVEVEHIDAKGERTTTKGSLLEYVQGLVNGHMKTYHSGVRVKWEGMDHPGTLMGGGGSWSRWKETLTVYLLESSIIIKATRIATLPYDPTNPVLCRMFESVLGTKIAGWNAFGESDRKRAEYQARLAAATDASRPWVATP
jgi:hypothetical protein